MLIEIIGWIGVILLTLCGIPQVYTTYKTKETLGLSLWMLIFWLVGEALTGLYVVLTIRKSPLLFNQFCNIIIVSSIIYLYFKYKKKND